MAVDLRPRPSRLPPAPRRRDPAAARPRVGAGALVAASLPPWGWWPLAFVGIAILDRLVADRPARVPLRPHLAVRRGLAGARHGLDVVPHRARLHRRRGVLRRLPRAWPRPSPRAAAGGAWRCPAALTVAEAVRFAFPFGGVPLASLGISQAARPLSQTARLGGVAPHHLAHVHGRQRPAAAWERSWRQAVAARRDRRWRSIAARRRRPVRSRHRADPHGRHRAGRRPAGHPGRRHRPPGGRSSATSTPPALIDRPVDLVVWPENVIDVNGVAFADSPERAEVAAEAARLGRAHRGRRHRGRRRRASPTPRSS